MGLSIYDTTKFNEPETWFTLVTSWNYILCVVYYLTIFALHLRHHMTSSLDENESRIGWREKFYWVLYTTSFIVCIAITVLFWALLFDESTSRGAFDLFLSIDRHGLNLVLLLFEFMVNKIPVRIYHYIHPFVFLILYVAFNGVYFEFTGLLVYDVLDWTNPTNASLLVIGVAVSGLFLQFIFYFIDYLKRRFIAKEEDDDIV